MILNTEQILNPSYNFQRIISLVPSLTELMYDLDLDEEVIGITKFCVHPVKWLRSKTRVGGTKNVHIEIIHRLKPDLIIANKEENTKEQVEELAKDYNILLTDINNLDSALLSIFSIGKLAGKSENSIQIVNAIRDRFKKLSTQFQNKTKHEAAYLIWQKPYMAAGGNTYINDMMQYCGLRNIFSDIERYPEITLNEIRKRECGIVLLSSEPYPFKERHADRIKNLLPGVKIVLADGEMFSWYGSRLLKAADYFETFHSKFINENS